MIHLQNDIPCAIAVKQTAFCVCGSLQWNFTHVFSFKTIILGKEFTNSMKFMEHFICASEIFLMYLFYFRKLIYSVNIYWASSV